jgi:hypothetical protein
MDKIHFVPLSIQEWFGHAFPYEVEQFDGEEGQNPRILGQVQQR